jgi:hypothetical protein
MRRDLGGDTALDPAEIAMRPQIAHRNLQRVGIAVLGPFCRYASAVSGAVE